MQRLTKYRVRTKALPDYLNFAALVEDGVVLCKDGSLLRAFTYAGVDIKELTQIQRESLSDTCNRALQRLGSGWSLWFECVKRPSSGYFKAEHCHFPDRVSLKIDEERREFFSDFDHASSYSLEHLLFMCFKPPLERNQKIVDQFLFGEESSDCSKDSYSKILDRFLRTTQDVADALSVVIDIAPLVDVEEDGAIYSPILSYLRFCITNELHPFLIPPNPMYLDGVLGRVDAYASHELCVDQKEIGVIAIDGFPAFSYPQVMHLVETIPEDFRWSSRYICLDHHEARGSIIKYRRKWQQKVRSITAQLFKTQNGIVDFDAQLMVDETENALSDLSSNLVSYGYYTSVIIVHGETRAEVTKKQKLILKTLKAIGFSPRVETINTTESWLGSIPSHSVQNIRRPLISTRNLADLLPLTNPFCGSQTNPSPLFPEASPALFRAMAPGNVPFDFNLHISDTGHSFIFGPSGSGKSVLLSFIAVQFLRYKDAQIFAFDKGRSMYALTQAVGGTHVELSEDNSLSLCPLSDLESVESVSHACEWIEKLMELQGVNVTPQRTKIILDAINQLKESSNRSLSTLQICLQDKELKDALYPYLSSGATAGLFDAETDTWDLQRFVTFEMEHVMGLGEKYVLPFLLYLFRKIERRLTGEPTLILLDEAWIFLSHPLFAARIREWLKVLRKANCALVMSSQSLSDVEHSDIADVISQECRTKIYLSNSSANTEMQREKYLRLGVNENDLGVIENLTSKREYYVISPEGRAVFDLALGPYARSILTKSSKQDVRHLKEQQKSDNWRELLLLKPEQQVERAA